MSGLPPWWHYGTRRAELVQIRRELYMDGLLTDLAADQIERRVVALEEIVAARWPRSLLVRRRLARALRASIAGYRWAGPDFSDQRTQAIGDEWGGPSMITKPFMQVPSRGPGRHGR